MNKKILILNGPNLNLLGMREPHLYGSQTLDQIYQGLRILAEPTHVQLDFFQSNAEHLLIDKIHEGYQKIDFIIFNPAALTHTSIALRDALLAVQIPFIEVHLSDLKAREAFRQHSYFSDIALKVISGQGVLGYELALRAAIEYFCAA